ncbi:layilin isoform X1 [Oncorhynchus kisutch]|uniref:Layilin n=1 Tax=Oncorhynchus kisutch TaxID=8019 RepID=A0A8C7GNT0_ONCKI|nr:layilin-like isoform X1 [Oncorhynchus kisutch]XP_029529096.1 layilin-like [Oncorhynchus nerka]
MDFVKLLGTVLAVFCHLGFTQFEHNGQRICRRGTERPCYRINYFQDPRRRVTFDDARQACRTDGAELLSIETDNEQRLVERFIQQLQATDGDFWIGLHRSPRHWVTTIGCPSQYYWLDGSKARFRNWHWDEPSCGNEMCVVLYHQPSAPPDEGGRLMFQWNDDNCNTRNNFVCKYSEEKLPVFTVVWNSLYTVAPIISLIPILPSAKVSDEKTKLGLSESSVSLSDNVLYVSYILFATIPILLLLLVATGVFCYKRAAKRRKSPTDSYPKQEQWGTMSTAACNIQGPYAYQDITKLQPAELESMAPESIKKMSFCASSFDSQCDDYENVSNMETVTESGFVTNDIYEDWQNQGRHYLNETGWVENEIYE